MKHLSTLIVALLIPTASLWAQADTASNAANWKGTPNPGFENWTTTGGYANPNGWNSANSQETALGTYGCVKATGANAKVGSAAVELITQNEIIVTAPGIVTTGTIPTSSTGSITGGIAYTLRPDSIVGWYKYTPQGTDNCFAAFYLFGSAANNADTVAEASFSTAAGIKTANYTRFSAPLKYRNSDPVVNSIWLLSSSNGTSGATVGSSAYFDELAVIINSTTGIANQVNTGNNITVSPNPASDHIIVMENLHSSATLAIYDITGRKISEQKLDNGSNTIDVKSLTNGIYIYTVVGENNNSVKTGKLIIQK